MKTAKHGRANSVAALTLAAGMAAALVAPSAVFAQERALPVTSGQAGTGQPAAGRPVPTPANRRGTSAQPTPGGRNVPVPNAGRNGQPGANKGNPNGGGEDQARPGGDKEKHEVPGIDAGDDMIEFSGFSEAVELATLVEIAASTLHINIWVDPELSGSVVFNAPVKVKKEDLLPLVQSMLEMFDFTITKDTVTGWYKVHKVANIEFQLDGEAMRTEILETPGVRPSSLKPTIDAMLGGGAAPAGGAARGGNRGRGGNPGQPQMPGDDGGQPGGVTSGTLGGSGKIAYNDELGIIIVTDTQRKLEKFKILVQKMLDKHGTISLHKIELNYVSPSVAKQRILELFGQAAAAGGAAQNRRNYNEYDPNQGGQQPLPTAKTTMDNIGERLSTDPNGNRLFFRGNADELFQVQEVVDLIDAPSNLVPDTYYAGAAAKQIADIAKQRGLGEVTTIQSLQDMQARNAYYPGYYDDGRSGRQQGNQPLQGGPVMVVDEGRGTIIYYATLTQHQEFNELIRVLRPEDDTVVIRAYRLIHADSEKVSAVLMGLINSQTPTSNSDNRLDTGGGGGGGTGRGNAQPNVNITMPNPFGGPNPSDLSLSGRNTFALADVANNQVMIKAPLKEQAVFAELIRKLDLKVPQVSVEAKIVAVSANDTFRLAFETQLINANGTGGVFNTNFGLGTYTTGSDVRGTKVVPPLSGGTFALIKSDQVPIIISALQSQGDGRVLSNPQILLDANAEGTVESKDQQPTQEISRGDAGQGDIVTAGNYVDAGTKLTIKKPQIGPGDSVRMGVVASLSSFTGEATATLPPPKQDNTIDTIVQVPSNMTVVIGGVTVDTNRHSLEKIPILGDVPLVGFLFRSQRDTTNKTVLYIFLTPKICRDPNFRDNKMLTDGPMKVSQLEPDLPSMKPVLVDVFSPESLAPAAVEPGAQPPSAPAPEAQPTTPTTPTTPPPQTPAGH